EGEIQSNVKQWMINRYFQIDKDWATLYKNNWNWFIDNLKTLCPKSYDLQFKEIKRDLEPIFTLNGIDCYLEEISAGFQAFLSVIFAIIEWIELTNEDCSAYVPEAVGTVIIDELDVHLHPEWQLTIRESLAAFFPKLQFITTTHSPHLIASAHPGEIIILPELCRNINIKPTEKSYSGWNTDQILEDVMGVKSLENKTYATY
ncbi:MAG: AAA family ATPase, partial [Oscillospiraceae bacterium]|nr:AAA family ATPase [Oscillospiraceae bacterium]